MKKAIIAIAVSLVCAAATAKGGGHSGSHGGSHSVKGHVTKSGTYVAPHHATNPNSSKRDNWSSKPNTNPYTGQTGKKNPDNP